MKNLLVAMMEVSRLVRTPQDIDNAAKLLQEMWGGPCGDDVAAQVTCAVLIRACFDGVHADAIVETVADSME